MILLLISGGASKASSVIHHQTVGTIKRSWDRAQDYWDYHIQAFTTCQEDMWAARDKLVRVGEGGEAGRSVVVGGTGWGIAWSGLVVAGHKNRITLGLWTVARLSQP